MDESGALEQVEVQSHGLVFWCFVFLGALITGFVVGFCVAQWLSAQPALKPNEIGDMIAGWGAVTALYWLVFGFFLQAYELRQNSATIAAQLGELEQNAKALHAQTEEMRLQREQHRLELQNSLESASTLRAQGLVAAYPVIRRELSELAAEAGDELFGHPYSGRLSRVVGTAEETPVAILIDALELLLREEETHSRSSAEFGWLQSPLNLSATKKYVYLFSFVIDNYNIDRGKSEGVSRVAVSGVVGFALFGSRFGRLYAILKDQLLPALEDPRRRVKLVRSS